MNTNKLFEATDIPADVMAKQGDTIFKVSQAGNVSEVLVLNWGKKRATVINKSLIGTAVEQWSAYHLTLTDGKLMEDWPKARLTHHYIK
jgi:hypothetical protein